MSQLSPCAQLIEILPSLNPKVWSKKDGGLYRALVELCATMCQMQYPWLCNVDNMTLHAIYEEMRSIRPLYDADTLRTIDRIYLLWSEWDVIQKEMYYAAKAAKLDPKFFDIDDSQCAGGFDVEGGVIHGHVEVDASIDKGKKEMCDIDVTTQVLLPDHTKWSDESVPVKTVSRDQVENVVTGMANLMMAAGNPYEGTNVPTSTTPCSD